MLKLLIADTGEEFCLSLAELLSDTYMVRTCQEGQAALELMAHFQPDVAVLDMMMPGVDGVTLLKQVAALGLRPRILATTRFNSTFLEEELTRLDVDYLMIKPCDLHVVKDRLADLTQEPRAAVAARPADWAVVSNVLLSLGLLAKHDGYQYLRDAVLEEMEAPGQPLKKGLYPKVGAPYGAGAEQVEQAIRSAVDKAWARRDEVIWRRYFQPNPDGTLSKPSNGEIITSLAVRIQSSSGGIF